ncbi:MAG: hypothetical protein KAV87_07405 [Desulfobacteraceae bacterium]|nr:hypothetical protein [Desulfobacteraceae bacterium]
MQGIEERRLRRMSNTLQGGDRLPASGGKAIRQRRINAADDALTVDQELALSLTRFYRSFIVVSISYSIFEERNSFPGHSFGGS